MSADRPTGVGRATAVAAPLRRQVVELLREGIATHEFPPGQRLVERDLVERFGVSRTVVREALRQCESEGLVVMLPNHGPAVFHATYEQAQEIYESREMLEAFLAQHCAERGGPAMEGTLRLRLDAIRHAYENEGLVDQLRAKDELYRAIAEGAQNSVVAAMASTITIRVQMLRRFSLEVGGRRDSSVAELAAVVDAIVAGDGPRAAALAAEHVRNAANAALQHFAAAENDGSSLDPTVA